MEASATSKELGLFLLKPTGVAIAAAAPVAADMEGSGDAEEEMEDMEAGRGRPAGPAKLTARP